jgi:4'-phosphopantetheinyl transferase
VKRCDARAHQTGRFVMLTSSCVQRRRGSVGPLTIRDCVGAHARPTAGRGLPDSQAGVRLSLWWAPLDISMSALEELAACLSSEERQRANQLHRPLDRGRFLAARGWLRHLLASQLGCARGEIGIVAGDRGKPRLAGSELSFSAARTAGFALYATSWTMEVGVDIEAIRATADIDGIVARFMSPAEQRALMCLPPRQRLEACFQCWTRKEAFVKGIGTGLSFPLRDVDVWDGDGRSTTVSGWSVHQVDVAPGLAAAVAGASLGDWVAQVPRRLDALSLDHSYQPPPGRSPAGLAAPGG